MKILQVSNRVPWPLNEGGNIGIYNFTRAFNELGHTVTLYCLDGIKHNTPVEEAKEELSKYASTLIHQIDTNIKPLKALAGLLTNTSYNVSRFYNEDFNTKLIELLSKEKFDVIQLEGTFVGPYVATIRQYHQGLLSLRMHNVEYEIWERLAHNESNPIKKIYLNILSKQLKDYEAQLLQKVDAVIPVTSDDEAKFKRLNSTIQYHTTAAGIDLDTWKFTSSSSSNKWYHIGSMEWHANKEAVNYFLEEIHPKLTALDSRYELKLAGKGIQKEEFKNYKALQVFANVPSAFDFVLKNDVCVVPLLSGSGIRLKILEAMAAGKLVVSTTIGAQGINYNNREHLLIANNPAEFVAIYRALQSGEIDATSIIRNARLLIENEYSTKALAAKQMDFYQARINS
ncbi:MAG: glycosyltransferase family 4 protein [Bacteroidia bacterium]|nr:glycosyltransferase family 4 protein [Bacteroidia bacterium]NNJ54747.1 glycosyltransferase [Bacteroidia bacterium]